jgi:hypothetical protein
VILQRIKKPASTGVRPAAPAPSVLVPPAEPSPLHEAILAWLDQR